MIAVGRRDDHAVRPALVEHLVEVAGVVRAGSGAALGRPSQTLRESSGVRVAEPDELGAIGVPAHDGDREHPGTDPETDLGVADSRRQRLPLSPPVPSFSAPRIAADAAPILQQHPARFRYRELRGSLREEGHEHVS